MWVLVSPDGVSASVNLPLHHKVQKFSSGTGSPGWSRKKGRKNYGCGCGIVAYRPLVELVALFALTIRCRGLDTADINVFIGRTTNFFHSRVRFLRDHFSTQGRLA